MRQAKEFTFPHPFSSKRRMDLLLFFRGIPYAQRTQDPIFLRGAPGVALVGLGETDLGAACGHSDFHEARHGTAVEGVDPSIGDCDGCKGAARGLKEEARGPKAPHGRGEESQHNRINEHTL